MKWRIFFTTVVFFTLSFLIYQIAWYAGSMYARSGEVISSWDVIAFFLVTLSIVSVWAIWNLEIRRTEQSKVRSIKALREDTSLEKRKRERLDSVLRDLSNEDLLRLKERLMDGTINDDSLEKAILGEDGELLRERR